MNLKGHLANGGVGIAKVYKLTNNVFSVLKKRVANPTLEIEKYHKAISKTRKHIETLINLSVDASDIFKAHDAIANDRDFISKVEHLIILETCNLEYAIQRVAQEYVQVFNNLDDPYMKARSKDIIDVSTKIIHASLNIEGTKIPEFTEPVIVVAEDLLPSQTVTLDNTFVRGLITEQGSQTSHTAIIAKLYNIPALVGVEHAMDFINDNQLVILDADNEKVVIDPDQKTLSSYEDVFRKMDEEVSFLNQFKRTKAYTQDGKQVPIYVNIGSLNDLDEIKKINIDGVGLVRTEFLYLDRIELPDEEEQFNIYKFLLTEFPDLPVTFRTLDIGGDKLQYQSFDTKESNPFLGERAIRLSLKYPEVFKTQIRALLRAGLHGKLRIMLPMIATLTELIESKALIVEAMNELEELNISFTKTFELGIMIEVPSAALISDQLAPHVDFFSLGTNDLIQYTFAADRMNAAVSYLYQPLNAATLRLIQMVSSAAKKHNISLSVCGEMASLKSAIPYFVSLDISYLSMITSQILKVKSIISRLNYQELSHLSTILEKDSPEDIETILLSTIKQ